MPLFGKKKEQERYAEEQRAKGLAEYKGKWETPEQVQKWKREDEKKVEQLIAMRKSPKTWAATKTQQPKASEGGTTFVSCPYCHTKYDLSKSSFCPNCRAPYKG